MQTETATIQRANTTDVFDLDFPAKYLWNGKYHILERIGSGYKYHIEDVISDPKALKQNTEPAVIMFDYLKRELIFHWNIDDDGNPATPYDKEQKAIVYGFWRNAAIALWNGKENKGEKGDKAGVDYNKVTRPELNVVIKSDNRAEKLNAYKQTEIAHDKLRYMKEDELMDILYLFGVEVNGMGVEEIRMFLNDYTTGFVFKPGTTNLERFMDFIKEENKETNRYKINIQRAVDAGIIIKEQEEEHGIITYKIGNTILGANEDQCIAFFKQNKHIYENNVLQSLKPVVLQKEFVAEPAIEKKDTLKALQGQAKVLVEQGLLVHNINMDDPINFPKEVEQALAWRKRLELQFKNFATLKECISTVDPDHIIFGKGWALKSKKDVVPLLIKCLEEREPNVVFIKAPIK